MLRVATTLSLLIILSAASIANETITGDLEVTGNASIAGMLDLGTTTGNASAVLHRYTANGTAYDILLTPDNATLNFIENIGGNATYKKLTLGADNTLTLFSPDHSNGNNTATIVISPDTNSPGITINSYPVLTTGTSQSDSFAFGAGASVDNYGTMAVGYNAFAYGDGSVALGYDYDTSTWSVIPSIANGPGAVAFTGGSAGQYSFAFHGQAANYSLAFNGNATGTNSLAMLNGTASGPFSSAIRGTASGYGSTALGGGSAAGQNSTAIGDHVIADALSSISIGSYNTGGGNATSWIATDPLFQIGNGNATVRSNAFEVKKNGDVIISGNILAGVNATVSGATAPRIDIALGNNAKALNSTYGSIAIGNNATAIADGGPTAIGYGSKAIGYRSLSLGVGNNASGTDAIAIGSLSSASGSHSFALGYGAQSKGPSSITICVHSSEGNFSHGWDSMVLGGFSNNAHANCSTIINGHHNKNYSYASTVLGTYNAYNSTTENGNEWINTDPVLVVGNGNSTTNRSNALYLRKNGDMDVAGAVRIWPKGDISMGDFNQGQAPTTPLVP